MGQEKENVNTIRADDGTTWVEIASTGTDDECSRNESSRRPRMVANRLTSAALCGPAFEG